MLKRQSGFTLIELLITSLIVIFVIAGASQMFVGILTQFKQQSKIVETNIEGIFGLELLRRDLETAGYGLPWNNVSGVINYTEVEDAADPGKAFNDATSNPPRAIFNGNDTGTNKTDYVVIKSISAGMTNAAEKWILLSSPSTTENHIDPWLVSTGSATLVNLGDAERVIVLKPGTSDLNSRELVTYGAANAFFSQYKDVKLSYKVELSQTRIIYGVDSNKDLRMPFNRADYYLHIPGTTYLPAATPQVALPERCAKGPAGKGTGILFKAVVKHDAAAGGDAYERYPILDCVADIQVVFLRDLDNDGTAEDVTQDLTGSTAKDIRDKVREIRVYILAQEGQKDRSYTSTKNIMRVGEPTTGRDFDLSANITEWNKYRWKLYTIVVKPTNLR